MTASTLIGSWTGSRARGIEAKIASHLTWSRREFVRSTALVRRTLGETADGDSGDEAATVSFTRESVTRMAERDGEARAAGEVLAAASYEERARALRTEELTPELVYELFRRAEGVASTDPTTADAWTDLLVVSAVRLGEMALTTQRAQSFRDALVAGFHLRLELGLDLLAPWKRVDHDAFRLMEILEAGVTDPYETLRAWRALGRFCRERGELSAAESFLAFADALASEWDLPVDQASAALGLARLALDRGEPVPALVLALAAASQVEHLVGGQQVRLRREIWFALGRAAVRAAEPLAVSVAQQSLAALPAPPEGSAEVVLTRLVPWLYAWTRKEEDEAAAADAFWQVEQKLRSEGTGDPWCELWAARVRLDRIGLALHRNERAEVASLLASQLRHLSSYPREAHQVFQQLRAQGKQLTSDHLRAAVHQLERLGPRGFLLPVQ